MSQKTKARQPTRRASPREPEPGPGADGAPAAGGQRTGAARVEWLDPRVITWPSGRITSEYDDERSAALRQSMAELGQQDAVDVVQLEDGSYEGAGGMNRCTAAIDSGMPLVLCVIRQGTHRDVVRANLATAVNQSRANPLSEVEGIAHAHYDEGLDLEELLLTTGKSAGWVNDRLSIFHASPVVKQCLGDGQIAIGHAAVLAEIDGHAAQEEALSLQLAHGWTVRELEEHLRGAGQEGTRDMTRTRQRAERGPVACTLCEKEHEPAEVQRVVVCNGCAGRLKASSALEGAVAVPVELLRDAESLLAGSQAGARLAERISVLLEGAPT